MGSDKINILIVDHQTFGETLSKHLKEAGFNPILARKPSEAMKAFGITVIHAFIIESMLPEQSGIELAKQLKKHGADTQPFYFMSGLFKSKSFINSTLLKGGGTDFFEKPLDYKYIVDTLLTQFSTHTIESQKNLLFHIVSNDKMTTDRCIEVLNNTDKICGYDIPHFLSLVSRTNLMGTVKINSKNDMIKIYLSEGRVVSVISNDPQSYWGTLLVEKNMISQEELKSILSKDSSDKIGTRLLKANLMSPHMVDLIASEQAHIRLDKIVENEMYSFQFTQSNVSSSKDSILDAADVMYKVLSEFIQLRISEDYLEQIYLPYLEHKVVVNSNYKNRRTVLNLPFINQNIEVLNFITDNNCSFAEVLSYKNNDQTYKILHFLLLSDTISLINQNSSKESFAGRLIALKKFKDHIENKNYFQLMHVKQGKDFNIHDLKSSYLELSKSFHPDKLTNTSDEIKQISIEIFHIISVAYKTLLDPNTRAKYEYKLDDIKTESKLKSTNMLEEGKKHLKNYRIDSAYELLKRTMQMSEKPSTETILHYLWAKISKSGDDELTQEDLIDIYNKLDSVPTSERNNSVYPFVKGLLQKKVGDYELSKLNFQQAVLLDKNFIIAKSELKKIEKYKKSRFGLTVGKILLGKSKKAA